MRLVKPGAWLGCAAFGLAALGGCQSAPRVAPVPESAWEASAGSHRTSYPAARREAARPGPSTARLSREQVLDLASRDDPQDAIAEIDRHPLAFALDPASLAWFEERLVAPEVVDYLRKRSHVDWDALNGRPEPEPDRALAASPAETPPEPVAELGPVIYVDVTPRSRVVYESSWSPGWYARSRSYSYDPCPPHRSSSSCGPVTYGSVSYGPVGYGPVYAPRTHGSRNPVVVTTATGSTTYRASSPYSGTWRGPRTPAGVYAAPGTTNSPAGVYRTRSPQPAPRPIPLRGAQGPVVTVTRTPR